MTARTVATTAVAMAVVFSTGMAGAQTPWDAPPAPPPAPPPTTASPPPSSAPLPTEPSPASPADPAPAETAPAPRDAAPSPPPEPRVRWKAPSAEDAGGEPLEPGSEEALSPSGTRERWQLGGAHVVLSVERVATMLAWKSGSTSGLDFGLLFGGGTGTISGTPRVALDSIFSGGFTLGGSLGLLSSSIKDGPELSGALFATRAGYFAAGGKVGFWLRGGFTYVSTSLSSEGTSSTGALGSESITTKLWFFTLDPQIVVVAAPRVGFTFGPLLDIPLSGTNTYEEGGKSSDSDISVKAYGVTSGLSAIF